VHTTDTTIIGNGGSPFAREKADGPVPFERVRDLFDFTVSYAPLHATVGDQQVEVPNRHALVRDDTTTVLNVVSKKYAIHQFSEVLIENLFALTDATETDLQILGAGLLSNGAVGWLQVQAPTMQVAGDDLAPTITLGTSHNGTLATSYRVGLFRFSCSNQIGALRSSKGAVYKLRHTKNSRLRIGDAREALGLLFAEAEEYAAEVKRLVETTVTDQQFAEIVRRMNPRPVGEEVTPTAVTRWSNRVDSLRTLWIADERVAPYRGTAWGAVQAFSTHRQWERPFRAQGADGTTTRLGRNMADYLTGRLDDDDSRAIRTVREVAAV
jgi:phage/plasmid-like protein (TIGR03299 family)